MTNLVIKQGSDGGVRFQVNDGATGLPYDLSGWAARAQVRKTVQSSTVLHEFTTALGTATCDALGFVTLTWSAAATSAWTWDNGFYSVELVSPAGKVTRLDEGKITNSREITR